MIHLLIFFSFNCLDVSSFYLTQDEAWWKVDFTPTLSPADDEAEASEEEEGELDSVGRLFLNLTENEAPSGFINNLTLLLFIQILLSRLTKICRLQMLLKFWLPALPPLLPTRGPEPQYRRCRILAFLVI